MDRIWDGTDEKGEQARIMYHDDWAIRPYQLSISTMTIPAVGQYGTLRGAKSECAKYTQTRWEWKEVVV